MIRNLPFGGIIGIKLLQNRSFQVMKDGKNVKLGDQLEPRVLGSDLLMAVTGSRGEFRCGTEALESPLSGPHNTIREVRKMEISPGNDQPRRDYTPRHDFDKPILSLISPIISLTEEATSRRTTIRGDRTQSKYVGMPACQGTISSIADPDRFWRSTRTSRPY